MELKNYIVNSFKYYDKIYEDTKKIFKTVKKIKCEETEAYFKYYFYSDIQKTDLLFEYPAGLIGRFIVPQKIWVWGWALPRADMKWIYKIKKVFDYGFSLSENVFIKSQLINSRIQITDINQLELYIALSLYLTKARLTYFIRTNTEGVSSYVSLRRCFNSKKDAILECIFFFDN